MLPHISIKALAALRATCTVLCSLVDVETDSIWQERAMPLLPSCLQPAIRGELLRLSKFQKHLCLS